MSGPTSLTLDRTLTDILTRLKQVEIRRDIIPNPNPTFESLTVIGKTTLQGGLLFSGVHVTADWNSATVPGIYYSDSAVSNLPASTSLGLYWTGLVRAVPSQSILTQTLQCVTSGVVGTMTFQRTFSSGSWGAWTVIDAVASSSTQRDQIFPTPVQGAVCTRSDKGWTEQYFGLWNSSTNPQGAAVAGWYPISGKLPKAILFPSNTGIGGITANQYCFRGVYMQTPSQNAFDGITFDGATGKFTCPTIGEYRLGWAFAQSTSGSTASLVITTSLNSTTSPTAASAGSVYGVNGVFAGSEIAANASCYTWNVAPQGLRISTAAVTDYFQFWFCGGSGTSVIVGFNSGYPAMNFAQFLSIEYVGPSRVLH